MEKGNNGSQGAPDTNEAVNPSKPMDSKKDVENANDEKINQDFPGYPHYPAKEDIMDQRTDSHRVDVNIEDLPNSSNRTGVSQRFPSADDKKKAMTPQPGLGDDDLDIRPGTEADVTDDDLAILNATNGEIGVPQNVDTEDLENDLDIPGSDLDDEHEAIGEEDEENNYYSLGGDRHEAQEEDPYSGPDRDQ
jgi:hypothetical protein